MALSDTIRDAACDGTLPDNWATATFRVRVSATADVDVGTVLEGIAARPAGDGSWLFTVRHSDHPSPDFAAGQLHKFDRGGVGGSLELVSVTTTAPERRQIGVSASGEAIYAP